MKLPPFTLVAPTASADGYGVSAEALALAAEDLGADLQFVEHDWRDDRFADARLAAMTVDRGRISERELLVLYFLPFAFVRSDFEARVKIGMTMFETDRMPPFWVPMCNQTQGLIVPSEFCRDAFQPLLDIKVKVVPLGVDTDFYVPAPFPKSPSAYNEFWFLMAGLLHYRKGAEYAVRAFKEEFTGSEKVRLILKTRRGFIDVGEESLQDDRIWVHDMDYTRPEMRAMYQNADCFIACSRGEASGLTPREALACGTPVILTDWGGLSEIADPSFCYVTGIDGLEAAPPQCSSYGPGVAGHAPIGNFCVPSVAELRVAMRTAFEGREENAAMGRRGALAMDAWSWQRCASKWLDALSELWTAAQ